MKHYILHIIKQNLKYRLSYKAGKFNRLERQSGFIDTEDWLHLTKVIPLLESDIQAYNDSLIDRVTITAIKRKPKSIWHQYVEAWKSFYQKHYGIEPKFDGVEGRHLKQLVAYLESVSSNPEEALTLWQALLSNWKSLDEFHQKNTDIKYINSNINRIIENVKRNNNNPVDHFEQAMQSDTARDFKFK